MKVGGEEGQFVAEPLLTQTVPVMKAWAGAMVSARSSTGRKSVEREKIHLRFVADFP